jgi:hypothetical protein
MSRVCEVIGCPALARDTRCPAHSTPDPAAERELRRRSERLREVDGRVLRRRRELADAEAELADAQATCAEMWNAE